MRLWTKAFIGLTFAYLLLFINMQTMLATLPVYAKMSFHADDFMASLMTGLFALSAIGGRFLAVALLKRTGRRRLLFLSILLVSSTTLAYGFAGSMAELLLVRICFAAGFGIASTIIPTWVTEAIPSSRMGEGIGIFGSATMVAMAIGPSIGLYFMNDGGFEALTRFSSVVALMILPLLIIRTNTGLRETTPDPSRKVDLLRLLVPVALNILLSVTLGSIVGFLVLYGKEQSFSGIGLFFLINFLAMAASRLCTGRLLDRKGYYGILTVGACLLAAGLFVLTFPLRVETVILSACLYGLGFGSLQPALHTWMLRQVDAQNHGTANAMFYNTTDLGVALGALCLGAVASSIGYGWVYGCSAGVMVLFLMIIGYHAFRTRRANAGQISYPYQP